VPADEALGRLLTAIGVPGDRIPADLDDRAAKWRRELAGRRALVLLDNAASAGQVRPLLPGAGGCLALVTSRGALPDLDATAVLSLPVLSAADALDLFSRVVGDARTASETSATGHVVELCGRLPLAVRIAASRLRDRTWTVSRLADRLRAESRRLSELSGGDRSVAGAFALSYANLPADRRRTFRLASLQPADEIRGHAAAALTGTPYPELERMLDDLVAAHLVDEPTAGRYRLHDLLRDYGRERAATDDSSDQRRAAVHRMLDYYLHVAADANSRLADEYDPLPLDIQHPPEATPALPDHAAAMAWFETERHTLLSVVRYAVAEGWDGHAWQLANELWRFYYFRGYLDDWLVVGRLAVGAAVRTGADIGLAASYNNLAAIHWRRAEIDQAIEAMRQTLEIRRRTGHRLGEAKALNNLGILYVERGAFAAALVPYREALDIYRDLGLEHKAALLLGNRATALRYLGRYEEALAEQLASLDAMRSAALAHNVAVALLKLGDAYLPLGRHDEALAAYAEALTLVRDLGDRYFEGFVLNGLGNLHRETGRYPQAVSYQQQALDRMRDLADREAEARILNDFALLYRRMGESAVAHDTYRAAVAVARTAGTRYEQARALAGMARSWTAVASVAGSDEEPRTAEDCRRAATELFAAQGVPEPALDRAGGDRHPAGTQ
jgi:tetratricopeptide (TPR) repeat protein